LKLSETKISCREVALNTICCENDKEWPTCSTFRLRIDFTVREQACVSTKPDMTATIVGGVVSENRKTGVGRHVLAVCER